MEFGRNKEESWGNRKEGRGWREGEGVEGGGVEDEE